MCKELKNSRRIKYLWETSGNIKIWQDSETAVIEALHQRNYSITKALLQILIFCKFYL